MDVQAGDTGIHPDPAATAVVPSAGRQGQGVLFNEAQGYSTFGDTDKIPAVTGGRGRDRDRRRQGGRPAAPRWLRLAVLVVVVAILGAAATLGLVKAGVINTNNNTHGNGSHNSASPPTTTATTATHSSTHRGSNPRHTTNTLLSSTGTNSSGAETYTIHQHAFGVTVTTSVGRSWVVIGVVGQKPIYEGILPPNSSQKEILLGPAQVQVGAGGTKVVVSSGRKTQTLTPPSAPFSYQITPT